MKLTYLIPRANILILRLSKGRLNLQAMLETTIEIRGSKRRVSARQATAEENASYWPRLTASYSFYADYQGRTTRDIAVIVLTPAS